MSFDFSELSLSSYDISTGAQMLKPGKYVCVIKDAKVGPNKQKTGVVMTVDLESVGGEGSIKTWINLTSQNAEATRIGRSELKTMLHFAGHPNPDRPGDVSTIKGLKVGVLIRANNYKKDGVDKEGVEVAAFIDKHEVSPETYTPTLPPIKKKEDNFGDDIPF